MSAEENQNHSLSNNDKSDTLLLQQDKQLSVNEDEKLEARLEPMSSPKKKFIPANETTPHKTPNGLLLASPNSAFRKVSNLCNDLNPITSPFIPFCRKYLSPICNFEENFNSYNSNRVLFSPM